MRRYCLPAEAQAKQWFEYEISAFLPELKNAVSEKK
jgi:hypothetical protein